MLLMMKIYTLGGVDVTRDEDLHPEIWNGWR